MNEIIKTKYCFTVAMKDHYDNIIQHNGFYFSFGHLISHELQYSSSIHKNGNRSCGYRVILGPKRQYCTPINSDMNHARSK